MRQDTMFVAQRNTYINKKTIKKGLAISAIIGSTLNIINQGDFIFHLEWEKISFFKIILTYMTPFVVSVYSTVTALRDREQN